MMREIKFRAWFAKERKMADVKQIDFFGGGLGKTHATIHAETDFEKGGWYSKLKENTNRNTSLPNSNEQIKRVSLMQCTGVKDDVEKDIYEGDIIEIYNVGAVGKPEHYIGAVEFENGSFICDRADKSKSIPLHEVVGAAFSVEVIGNVYENQNILKSVRCCDCCGNNMYDGYYHEDSGDVVCDRECGNKHFEDFEKRNEALEIIWTTFEY